MARGEVVEAKVSIEVVAPRMSFSEYISQLVGECHRHGA